MLLFMPTITIFSFAFSCICVLLLSQIPVASSITEIDDAVIVELSFDSPQIRNIKIIIYANYYYFF